MKMRMTRRVAVLCAVVLVGLLAACSSGGAGEAQATLPWSEDFSDPASGWLAQSDSSAEVGYRDGVMRLLIKSPNQLAWASVSHQFSDFHLTLEATQVAGPDDNEYGVLARMEDAKHFYVFSISGDGYYMVSRYGEEGRENLAGDWAASDAIQTGAATNLLEVICQGSSMTFLVNGVQLAQVEDTAYARGGIGLYAGSFFEPDVEVSFDNLRLEEP